MSEYINKDDLLCFLDGSIEEQKLRAKSQKGRDIENWNAGNLYALHYLFKAVSLMGDDDNEDSICEFEHRPQLH